MKAENIRITLAISLKFAELLLAVLLCGDLMGFGPLGYAAVITIVVAFNLLFFGLFCFGDTAPVEL
jgi:hypothetical protein